MALPQTWENAKLSLAHREATNQRPAHPRPDRGVRQSPPLNPARGGQARLDGEWGNARRA